MIKKIVFFTLSAILFSALPGAAQGFATVGGRVVDAVSGKPVEGVAVFSPDREYALFADSAGRFTIPAKVGDTVRFSYFGYQWAAHTVSKSGDDDAGDIVLKKEGSADRGGRPKPPDAGAGRGTARVTGRVTDAADGAPMQYVSLSIRGIGKYDTTGKDGFFAIRTAVGDTLDFNFSGYAAASRIISEAGYYHIGEVRLETAGSDDDSGGVEPGAEAEEDAGRTEIFMIYDPDREDDPPAPAKKRTPRARKAPKP